MKPLPKIYNLFNSYFRLRILNWVIIGALLGYIIPAFADGTKQLEPAGAPSKSYCRMALSEDYSSKRLPFALLNCPADYKLNITVSDFTTEKINLGFGNLTDYADVVKNDVTFQVRDPYGNVVPGFGLKPIPFAPGAAGFIETRAQAEAGPNINNTNPSGFIPLVITPLMNGNYTIEFDLPGQGDSRIFRFFDFSVTNGYVPIPGRLWSKAWQFSSASNDGVDHQSYAVFNIYSNDGIVTSLDVNGLSGGIWGVFSNEMGCSTSGAWNDRRKSIVGNSTILPQYKIFLTNPDPLVFPTGIAGVLNDFQKSSMDCDTIMTFSADVSKAGNIEILIDVPPLNPGGIGAEDVQLAYPVIAGLNVLNPGWDGLNAFGVPVASNSQVEVRVRFLNGLSNIPLYDVENNPQGFKVDIVRPIPPSGETKLRLFWDDKNLPGGSQATSNVVDGCIYGGVSPVSGCHEWTSYLIGNENTLNSWWYYAGEQSAPISYGFRLSPPSGKISGPANVCSGQLATFKTRLLPFARKYVWEIAGPGFSKTIIKDAPDTTMTFEFYQGLAYGLYSIKLFGTNPECGNGPIVNYTANLYEFSSPVNGPAVVCTQADNHFSISGVFSGYSWSCSNGVVIGSSTTNPVAFRWNNSGADTLVVTTQSVDCGTRISKVPIFVHPSASASFSSSFDTTCPNIKVHFVDNSNISSGNIISRLWNWDDGSTLTGNIKEVDYTFANPGIKSVQLSITSDQGCEIVTTNPILIIPAPEASFSVYRNCISDTVQISDGSTGIGLTSWVWDFGITPLFASNINSANPKVLYGVDGVYPVQMMVYNRFGCADTLQQSITIHTLPVADFSFPTLCENTNLEFKDNSIVADAAFSNYLWVVQHPVISDTSYEGNPVNIRFDDASQFIVFHKVIDTFGCSDTLSKKLNVLPSPEVLFTYTEKGGTNSGVLDFSNQTSGADSYIWNFGNGVVSFLETPSIAFENEGEYLIVLIGNSTVGCSDTMSIVYNYTIPDLNMPNAFTPGNDQLNNYFLPALPRKSLEPYTFQIFNRYGQMLFETSNPFQGWDGTFRNELCPPGVYVWVVNYNKIKNEQQERATKRGVVTLLR